MFPGGGVPEWVADVIIWGGALLVASLPQSAYRTFNMHCRLEPLERLHDLDFFFPQLQTTSSEIKLIEAMLPTRPNIASLIVLFLLSECLLAAPSMYRPREDLEDYKDETGIGEQKVAKQADRCSVIHPITVLTVIWDPGANSIAYKEAAAKIDPEEVLGHMPKSKDH